MCACALGRGAGIGLPWTIAALYAVSNGEDFVARSCGFGLSVFIYCIFALVTLGMLIVRRFTLGGELGGDFNISMACAVLCYGMWLIYVVVSSMRYYDDVSDLWAIKDSLAPDISGACSG